MGRAKPILFFILIFFINTSNAYSDTEISFKDMFWAEIFIDQSYRKTNLASDMRNYEYNFFYKEEDFIITDANLNLGLEFELGNGFYVDPYFHLGFVNDWGSKEWNDVFWWNNIIWGFGGSLRYEYIDKNTKKRPIRLNYLNIDAFCEYLFLDDSFDSAKDKIPDNISSGNLHVTFKQKFLKREDELGIISNHINNMAQELKKVISQVNSEAGSLSSISSELSTKSSAMMESATEQASSYEELASAMEEMAANIKQNADNAKMTKSISMKKY